jgi:hypothetical protein
METTLHKIKVNEFISIDLNIPKEMSPLDFMAITKMANKICNIGGVAEEVMPVVDVVNTKIEKTIKRRNKYTDEIMKEIYQNKNLGISMPLITKKINEKYGTTFSTDSIHNKLHCIKYSKRQAQ